MKDSTELAPRTSKPPGLHVKLLGGRGDGKGNVSPKESIVWFDLMTLKNKVKPLPLGKALLDT